MTNPRQTITEALERAEDYSPSWPANALVIIRGDVPELCRIATEALNEVERLVVSLLDAQERRGDT